MTPISVHPAYQAAVDRLLARINYERTPTVPYNQRQYKLARMHELLERLGRPDRSMPIVHVAGTKGKGSVSAMVAGVLRAAGYRTALYNSPHLDRIEERFAVDGQPCTSEQLIHLVDRVHAVVAAMDEEARQRGGDEIGPTYFEMTTAMALCHFAESAVDVAVLEVGLGGRLDSTNVCQSRVSVITSISYDHEQQLGNTLEAIAREKAGIIKPGVPVVSGVLQPGPREVIREIAAERGSRLLELGIDFDYEYRPPSAVDVTAACGEIDYRHGSPPPTLRSVQLALLGRHQGANAAVALATLGVLAEQGWNIDEPALRRGLAEVRWPARLEVVSRRPTILLDAAHNVASIEALLATIDESFATRQRSLVFATSRDKNIAGMLERLLPRFDRVILTRYLSNPRGATPEALATTAAEVAARLNLPHNWQTSPDAAAAWNAVTSGATPEHLICITGSFFLAAEMRRQMELAAEAARR